MSIYSYDSVRYALKTSYQATSDSITKYTSIIKAVWGILDRIDVLPPALPTTHPEDSWVYNEGSKLAITHSTDVHQYLSTLFSNIAETGAIAFGHNGIEHSLRTTSTDVSNLYTDSLIVDETVFIRLRYNRHADEPYSVTVYDDGMIKLQEFCGSYSIANDVSILQNGILQLGMHGSLTRDQFKDLYQNACLSGSGEIQSLYSSILLCLPTTTSDINTLATALDLLTGGWTEGNVVEEDDGFYSFHEQPIIDVSPVIGWDTVVQIGTAIISAVGSIINPILGLVAYGLGSLVSLVTKQVEEGSRNYCVSSNIGDSIRGVNVPVIQTEILYDTFLRKAEQNVVDMIQTSPTGAIVLYGPIGSLYIFLTASNTKVGIELFLNDASYGFYSLHNPFPALPQPNQGSTGISIPNDIAGLWMLNVENQYIEFMQRNAYTNYMNPVMNGDIQSKVTRTALRGLKTSMALLGLHTMQTVFKPNSSFYNDFGHPSEIEMASPAWYQETGYSQNRIGDDDDPTFKSYLMSAILTPLIHASISPQDFSAILPADDEGPWSTDDRNIDDWVGFTNFWAVAYQKLISTYDVNHDIVFDLINSMAQMTGPSSIQGILYYDLTMGPTTYVPESKYSIKEKLLITGCIAAAVAAVAVAGKITAKKFLLKANAKANADLMKARTQFNSGQITEKQLVKAEKKVRRTSKWLGVKTASPAAAVDNADTQEFDTYTTLYQILTGDIPQ